MPTLGAQPLLCTPAIFLVPILCLMISPAQVLEAQTDSDLANRVEREAVELHDFLEDWFCARLPKTEAGFARFDEAIGEDFVIVAPDGSLLGRKAIVAAVYGDHGRWADDETADIDVRNVKLHHTLGEITVATYEEWQTTADGTVTRLSSIVFTEDETAPLGLSWLHLHEVWLEGDSP